MIQKKVCMLGSFAVGKTSLVARFVKDIFSENYQTTIGVKIEKKAIAVEGQAMNLILWDLYGVDGFLDIRESYLQGSSGYLIVADHTRPNTLDHALDLARRVKGITPKAVCVILLNKADLIDDWGGIPAERIQTLRDEDWHLIQTSAKTGLGVEEAFLTLATHMFHA